ncbi:MAG: hypothetical protein AAGM84_14565 [Pseudomonadota bacterium]
MTRLFLLPLVLAALSACVPVSTYYREGASVAFLERTQTACEVAALRDAPVATVTRQGPPRYIPGPRVCDAAGKCFTRAGYYVPGPVYTVDVNKDLRERVEQQCMADKGFVPVSIPACPPGIANAVTPGATKRLPKLRPEACAIRNSDGSFQIVNRG